MFLLYFNLKTVKNCLINYLHFYEEYSWTSIEKLWVSFGVRGGGGEVMLKFLYKVLSYFEGIYNALWWSALLIVDVDLQSSRRYTMFKEAYPITSVEKNNFKNIADIYINL